MYKNKVLGLLSWAWLCPCLGEEAEEGLASLSGNRSLLALLPNGLLRPLPSFWRHYRGDCGTIMPRLALCFGSFPSFLGNPLTAFPQSPMAPSTQHYTVLAACLAGQPRVQVPFLPPNPQGTM